MSEGFAAVHTVAEQGSDTVAVGVERAAAPQYLQNFMVIPPR